MNAELPMGVRPLAVDLDGTLLRTDLLHESLFSLLKGGFWRAIHLPRWLLPGKAHFKQQIADRSVLDVATLPYREDLLEHLRDRHDQGAYLVLATASDRRLAVQVADHVGLFEEVLASDGVRNLAGANKRDLLVGRFGAGGFDYVGNSWADLDVWQAARVATVVTGDAALIDRVRAVAEVDRVYTPARPRLGDYFRALRLHQWLKNLLVFVPLFTAHTFVAAPALRTVLGFLSFGLAASSTYLLNDVLDLSDDRAHPRKKTRPFAAGTIPLSFAFVAIPAMLLAAALLGAFASTGFLLVLSGYVVLTVTYSLHLKALVLVDVVTLAAFYTLRIVGGGFAAGVAVSFWLLSFSMFLFFSLALVKRSAELTSLRSRDESSMRGRNYQVPDLDLIRGMGIASGYLAVLVFALFINSPEVVERYRHPAVLWLICPLLLYWISRVWIKAGRGEMHDDPVVFAIRDRASRFVVATCALAALLAR